MEFIGTVHSQKQANSFIESATERWFWGVEFFCEKGSFSPGRKVIDIWAKLEEPNDIRELRRYFAGYQDGLNRR